MSTLAIGRTTSSTSALRRATTAVLGTSDSGALTFLRIVLGLVMVPHGLQKTVGWFGGYGFSATLDYFSSIGAPLFFGFLAILAETAGVLGLLSGLTTRIAAFGIGMNMLVAGLLHSPNGFLMNWSGTNNGEGFEYHILAGAIALVLIVGGGGRFSLDRALTRR